MHLPARDWLMVQYSNTFGVNEGISIWEHVLWFEQIRFTYRTSARDIVVSKIIEKKKPPTYNIF